MTTLSRSHLLDLLKGCTILGTGGGGDLGEGLAMIDEALAAGKTFELVPLDSVPDEAIIATPYLLGAISDLPPDEEALYEGLPRTDQRAILLAYERAQAHLGRSFYGAVPCELGGSNTAVAFYVAAMTGQKVVDADPAGRAVPEITHSTYFLAGLPAAPIIAANEFGEVITLEHVQDDRRAETLVRALSVVSRHDIAAVDHALPAAQLRGAIIPGTLSLALRFGKCQREAQSAGRDVAQAIADLGQGKVVFRGAISACDWRTEGGFTLGSLTILGDAMYEGQSYRIAVKNENMAAWLDGAIHATIPDLICVFDTETGDAVTNPHYQAGQQVAVVILPAPAAFRTTRGLEIFGPRYAGLSGHFISPLDDL